MKSRRRVFARTLTTAVVTVVLAAVAAPAWACGFLIAENGAIRLSRFAALAAWEDGVEHYVTSFEFQGPSASFGAIVPLPAEPTTVERAGDWTLQRLNREVNLVPPGRAAATADSAMAEDAEVLATYEVEALDIAILRGGGQAVLQWAADNGFQLGVVDDATQMLDFYADRGMVFAAVRYDLERAAEADRVDGDGTPVHFEMPLDAPWVPLRILTFDKPGGEIVEADIYLLTPDRPTLLPDAELDVAVSEPASQSLLEDLRTDEASEWIPERAWFTYIDVSTPARDLTFDLAVGVEGRQPDPEAAFGVSAVSNGSVGNGSVTNGSDPLDAFFGTPGPTDGSAVNPDTSNPVDAFFDDGDEGPDHHPTDSPERTDPGALVGIVIGVLSTSLTVALIALARRS